MLEWLTKRNKKKKNHVGEQQNNNTREKQKQLVSHNLYLCREERGRGAELESVCVQARVFLCVCVYVCVCV